MKLVYCSKCGGELLPGAAFCSSCGAPVAGAAPPPPTAPASVAVVRKRKNAILAAVLSFLLAGLGHFYLGEWKRGAAWLTAAIAVGIVLTLALPKVPSIVGLIVGIASAWDARRIALAKYA
jgi:TM2 domain-containing membrane protein YozV